MRIQGYSLKGKFVPFNTKACYLYMIKSTSETFIGEFESRDKAERFSEQHDYRGVSWRIDDKHHG